MLIEGLGTATIVNGMMRIETLYRNAKGEDVSGPELLIPVSRVAAVAQGLQLLLERAQEAAKSQAAASDMN
ncbi:hypothetical protein ACLBKT_10485 [Erythrobacter sp. W302b]|uniref:hypothetical protein n=1 Tax=Erythrobacter sp. W302b TaxID=3389874 RepID=UPI00396B37DB